MEAEDIPKLIEVLTKARQMVKGRIEFVLEPRLTDDLVAPYYMDMDFPLFKDAITCGELFLFSLTAGFRLA